MDDELHKPYQKSAIDHRDTILFKLNWFTKYITDFIRKNNIILRTKVFFISDHGSTFISKNIDNLIDINHFKKIKNIDPSHRYISVDDVEFNEIKNNTNMSANLFFIEKTIAGDKNNYIIADSYNRFKDINDTFYVHGGALPEEIIVPSGYFQYNMNNIEEIKITLIKNEFIIKTKETLKLRISNSNLFSLNNILIKVYADEIDLLSEIDIEKINEQSDIETGKDIRITSKSIKNLTFTVSYSVSSFNYETKVKIPIILKSIVSEKKPDFDDI